VVKSDKCIGVSQLLGARARAAPKSTPMPAPTSLCRRRRAGQFWSAALVQKNWRRRLCGGGGQNFCSKVREKFLAILKFSDDFF